MSKYRTCSIHDCCKRHFALGFCRVHHARYKKYGDPLRGGPIRVIPPPSVCSVEGCERVARKRGWCNPHYKRWWRHGDPLHGRTSNGEPLDYLKNRVLTYRGQECLPWPYARNVNGDGRGKIHYQGRMQLVHRIVCEVINGPPPRPSYDAAHTCGNGHLACCNPNHIVWKTHKENQRDMLKHGTHSRGERCGTSKLTEEDVRQIRKLNGVLKKREIAEMFGVSASHVSMIHSGKHWSWLK